MELGPPHPLRHCAAHCGAAVAASGQPPPAPTARPHALARVAEILRGCGGNFPRSFELSQFAEFCARNPKSFSTETISNVKIEVLDPPYNAFTISLHCFYLGFVIIPLAPRSSVFIRYAPLNCPFLDSFLIEHRSEGPGESENVPRPAGR